MVASEIHRLSKRGSMPFIKINCAVIPSDLLESELFGHEKGAFTGAVVKRPGRFELAHEGTLFLDEIAEIPLDMQAKLLRAIQEREFERVGGVETVRVDVRLIAAANRDLGELVKAGRFREDLYYRLNVVPLTLPPLRDRKEDLEDLAMGALNRIRPKVSKSIAGIAPEVLSVFSRYTWPGNIRQLENVVERMVLLTESAELGLQDLPDELAIHIPANQKRDPSKPEGFKEIVRRRTQDFERDLIEKELAQNDGNVTRTAEKLGLSRKGLQLKMKELGIRR
jgi:transcriptional regulator with PAS, ATPase and Fis domain